MYKRFINWWVMEGVAQKAVTVVLTAIMCLLILALVAIIVIFLIAIISGGVR